MVPLRQREVLPETVLDFARHPGDVSARYVTLHDQTARSVLTVNHIRSLLNLYIRQCVQRYMRATGNEDQRVTESSHIVPDAFAETNHEVEHLVFLVDLGYRSAKKGGGQEHLEPSHSQTVAGHRLSVEAKSDLGNLHLRLYVEIYYSGHGRHELSGLLAQGA